MFSLAAGAENNSREGVRMGLFGAAQAIAFGLGGLAGTALADVTRLISGSPVMAYASVFAIESVLFVAAALLAAAIGTREHGKVTGNPVAIAALYQGGGG